MVMASREAAECGAGPGSAAWRATTTNMLPQPVADAALVAEAVARGGPAGPGQARIAASVVVWGNWNDGGRGQTQISMAGGLLLSRACVGRVSDDWRSRSISRYILDFECRLDGPRPKAPRLAGILQRGEI